LRAAKCERLEVELEAPLDVRAQHLTANCRSPSAVAIKAPMHCAIEAAATAHRMT